MAIHFVTGSKNKLEEVRSILDSVEQLDIDLQEIQEIDAQLIIRAKLAEALKYHKEALMVEDTSLYFDALAGLPGPLIKWFMKTIGNEGLFKIVEGFGIYGAEAKTIIGYTDDSAEVRFFEGSVRGTIVAPRGETNFGWDPIFQPDGMDKTFAELTADEKNAVSMRRQAVERLKEYLSSVS